MKNYLNMSKLGWFATLLMGVFFLSSCEKTKVVDETQLPSASQRYVLTHFPDSRIIQVVKEVDDLKLTYEVFLDSGFELEFDRKGEVFSVKSNRQSAIPNSTVPVKILNYVQANYADLFILEWELDNTNQEVKLSNGMELVFSKAGDFIRIDS